jgi:hypothetical protein
VLLQYCTQYFEDPVNDEKGGGGGGSLTEVGWALASNPTHAMECGHGFRIFEYEDQTKGMARMGFLHGKIEENRPREGLGMHVMPLMPMAKRGSVQTSLPCRLWPCHEWHFSGFHMS